MEKKFDLEGFIKNNKALFNTEEPPEGHFDRFQAKLDRKSGKSRSLLYRSMKYAAVIVLLISGYFAYDKADIFNKNEELAENINEEEDFTEVANYYDSQIDQKFEELNNITCKPGDGQKEIVNNDLNELLESYNELENELISNPENPMVRNAVINNYQMRIEILDIVINKLKNYC